MTLNPDNWQVRIVKPLFAAGIEFYFFRRTAQGLEVLQSNGSIKRIGEAAALPEPSFVISQFESKDLMKSLADALAEEGIKSKNEFQLEGELHASKYHLEDLRSLLKLK